MYLRFQFFKKCANLRLPLNVQKPKVLTPDPLTRGSAPGPRWELCAPDPRYRLTLPRSPWGRAPPQCPQILRAKTATVRNA